MQAFSFLTPQGKMHNVEYSTIDFGEAPLQGIIGQLAANAASEIHNHFEVEIFLFTAGIGVMQVGEQQIEVIAQTLVRVPPFINHVIKNTSLTEPLQFISLYWSGSLHELPPIGMKNGFCNTTIIFSTPPTPNGDMNLGHLSGPYLAADIYRRYLEYTGISAFHITKKDDYQTYIVNKAQSGNISPNEVADFSQQVSATLDMCSVNPDYFIKPDREGDYAAFVKKIFHELYVKGYIVAKTMEPLTRLYFNLSQFTRELNEYIKSTPMSAHALALSESLLKDGLPDICISYPGEWGITTPVSGFEEQTIYAWFERGLAYLWEVTKVAAEKPDNRLQVVHFYSFDNTFYHTLLFPAIYYALGIKPPIAHVVNELMDFEGGRDIVKFVPKDYIRWFLCEIRPEGSREDFNISQFIDTINQVFSYQLQNWLHELTAIITQQFSSVTPEPGAWNSEHRQFLQLMLSYRQNALESYVIEVFSPRTIVRSLRHLLEAALSFSTAQKPLIAEHCRDYLCTSTALSVLALQFFALLARPIIPDIANSILQFIGVPKETPFSHSSFVVGKTWDRTAMPVFIKCNKDVLVNSLSRIPTERLDEVKA